MRERLTITLKSEILKALDANIDGDRLRNRSHAVEYYLSKSLGQKEFKVLILAGGASVYFESEKKALPKSMVKIAGKPLLEQTLLKLKNSKFTDIVISVGEDGNIIKDYFKDGKSFGLNIRYKQQTSDVKGTAQALLDAKSSIGPNKFLMIYGDVLSDIDFGDLIQFHSLNKSAICTMTLTSAESVGLWGLARMQGSRVIDFEEKSKNPKTFSRLVNAGVYMMEPEIFSYLDKNKIKLENEVFPRLAEEGKLYGYLYEGLWLDISNSAAYKQAVKEMKNLLSL